MISRLLLLTLIMCLSSCGGYSPAPVVDGWKTHPKMGSRYRVQAGDTLYSIAFSFGYDYRDIAQVNHIGSPYAIDIGQLLVIAKPSRSARRIVVHNPTKLRLSPLKQHRKKIGRTYLHHSISHRYKNWRWPVKSHVLQRFTGKYGVSTGIDLSGYLGRPIRATAPGVVVYSGKGVRGYGNLVILKHSEEYLSAYAYASKRLVREGQYVKAGQRVALMGRDSQGRIRLHFELRRNGKPVNPLRYLH